MDDAHFSELVESVKEGSGLLKQKTYSFKYTHSECGGVTFYCSHYLQAGDPFQIKYFLLVNGKHPNPGDQIVCGACGKPFTKIELNNEVLKVD